MTVALPTGGIISAEPRFIDYGGILSGSLGGPDQRLNRMGSRWGADFVTKPMKGEEARIWISRLVRGTREKASIKFPQPGVTHPTASTAISGNPLANAEVVTLGAGTYREGFFFSVIHLGKRYIYNITGDGTTVVGIQPPLRTDLTNGDVAEFANAKIEGYVKGDSARWTIDVAKIYGLAFSIDEAG